MPKTVMETSKITVQNPASTLAVIEGTNEVHRERRGEHWVYVKRYLTDDWDATAEVISRRLELEISTIERVSQRGNWPRRLGRIRLADADVNQGLIATEEVPGISLEESIRTYRKSQRLSGLSPFHSAGRWLRHFQQIEVISEEQGAIGDKNPTDICEYVQIRIAALKHCGYTGLTNRQWDALIERLRCLNAKISESDRVPVMCHNDYSPGNIISDGYRVTPIDFQMTAPGNPLIDVSYFLHRLEMARLYRPWLIRPWRQWHQAFVRGYGREGLEQSPLYKALLLRLLVLRLLTYARQTPKSRIQSLHNGWVLAAVRYKLLRELKS